MHLGIPSNYPLVERFPWLSLRPSILLLATLCVAGAPGLALAQEVSAGLTGRVTDSSGGVVAAAAVTARDQDRGTLWSAQTNEDGIYAFPRIPSGTYTVRVEASGFKSFLHPNIQLEVNQRGRVDVTLQLGAVSESVEVRGDAALLQTETTQVGAMIGERVIDSVPLMSRNPLELTLLSPGVTTNDPSTFNTGMRSSTGGGRPYVNGNREEANNFLLDGVDNNETNANMIPYQPNPDAIQEFKMITSNASAEFGNFQGGVVSVVLKSGTNSFHGNVFESFRNDTLNANNWARNWQGLARQPLRWNQFGGTFGGAVKKNRLFFFLDYQGFRQAIPTSVVSTSVFPVAWRKGDFSSLLAGTTTGGKRVQLYNPYSLDTVTGQRAPFPNNQVPLSLFDPVATNLFSNTKLFPAEMNGSLTNNLIYSTHSTNRTDQGDIKLDWRPTDRDYFTSRLSNSAQSNNAYNSFLLAFPAFGFAPFENGVVNWTRTVNPHLVNEARFGVNHYLVVSGNSDNGQGDLAQALGMQNAGRSLLSLQGFAYVAAIGSKNVGIGNLTGSTTYHLADNLTMIYGRHMIKVGGQSLRLHMNNFIPGSNGTTGYMNFSGRFTAANAASPSGTLVGEADFVLGLPADMGRGSSNGTWGQRGWIYGLYAQDDWRVTDNLTLNLGLRWEYHSPWVEVADRQSNFDLVTGQLELAGQNGNSRALYNPFRKDFQPRLGFAYTPASLRKRVVVRGAYTISSFLEGTGIGLRLPVNPPFNPDYQALYNTPAYTLPPSRLSQGLIGMNPKDPYVGATLRVWDPNIRPAISQQWNFTTEYQLPGSNALSIGYVGQHGTHLMVPMPYLQKQLVNGKAVPGPFLAGNPDLLSKISQVSGTASTGNMKYHALQSTLRKRFAFGFEYQFAFTYSRGMMDSPGFLGTNQGQGKGQTNYFQNLYDRKNEWGPTNFDNKFVLTGSFVYQMPFGRGKRMGTNWNRVLDGALGGWELGGIYTAHTGFPLTAQITGDPSGTGSRGPRASVVGTPNDQHLIGPNLPYLDVSAYAVPTAYTFGNSAPGVVRGPGMSRVDVSLNKRFQVGEHKWFQLRLAAFNATNSLILNAPASMTITAPTFGQMRYSQSERNVQAVAKFYF